VQTSTGKIYFWERTGLVAVHDTDGLWWDMIMDDAVALWPDYTVFVVWKDGLPIGHPARPVLARVYN